MGFCGVCAGDRRESIVASRHGDWLKQGERDLAHARRSLEQGDYEWACFAAQQGAEKAVEAVFQKAGGMAWGHSVAGAKAPLV